MDIPPGSVVITPTELFLELRATHQAVTEMRGELKDMARTMPDHESRLRALERKVWVASGVAAGTAAGLVEGLRAALGG